MNFIGDSFCAELNSDDKHDLDLPLSQNKSYGGTMAIWKKSIDKYISIYPTPSSSFLPIIFTHPGSPISVHIGLYLPTSGQEARFVDQITQLQLLVEEIQDLYSDCIIYIRGDCNVNCKNRDRSIIFSNFIRNLKLRTIPILHRTYHHFVGGGLYDSNIDVILHTENVPEAETIEAIICKFENCLVESHHDIIISSIILPVQDVLNQHQDLTAAPKVPNNRVKISWNDDMIPEYQRQVSENLSSLRQVWSDPLTKSSLSLLLELSSSVLSQAAVATNNHVRLGDTRPIRKPRIPADINRAQSTVKKYLKSMRKVKESNNSEVIRKTKQGLTEARRKYKNLSRSFHHSQDLKRDTNFFEILSSNPSPTFKAIKSSKSSTNHQVPFLTVGSKRYCDDQVPDGFFDSISCLKSSHQDTAYPLSAHAFAQDYQYILKICQDKKVLPEISLEDSNKILFKMRPHVNDYFSITALHYINAGSQGLLHFNFLLNCIIKDVNLASVEELNIAYALLLHKGHQKSRTSDRSYRTISTCPFISKGLDMYIHQLYIDDWNALQAPTQYQGSGSSHELAALLVTEVIQHSKAQKQPLFLLFLDARSAFDTVVTEFLVRYLFLAGVEGDALLLLNNRLTNRKTYLDWNQTIMGPILDEQGVEQGGINSSDFYKLFNNKLLETLQRSCQGGTS